MQPNHAQISPDDQLSNLPPEVRQAILRYLSPKDLRSLAVASHTLNEDVADRDAQDVASATQRYRTLVDKLAAIAESEDDKHKKEDDGKGVAGQILSLEIQLNQRFSKRQLDEAEELGVQRKRFCAER